MVSDVLGGRHCANQIGGKVLARNTPAIVTKIIYSTDLMDTQRLQARPHVNRLLSAIVNDKLTGITSHLPVDGARARSRTCRADIGIETSLRLHRALIIMAIDNDADAPARACKGVGPTVRANFTRGGA